MLLSAGCSMQQMMGSSNEILDRLEQRVHDKLYETYFACAPHSPSSEHLLHKSAMLV